MSMEQTRPYHHRCLADSKLAWGAYQSTTFLSSSKLCSCRSTTHPYAGANFNGLHSILE
eukprot:gene7516-9810_t